MPLPDLDALSREDLIRLIVSFRQGCVTQEQMAGKFMKTPGGGHHEADHARCDSGADTPVAEAA